MHRTLVVIPPLLALRRAHQETPRWNHHHPRTLVAVAEHFPDSKTSAPAPRRNPPNQDRQDNERRPRLAGPIRRRAAFCPLDRFPLLHSFPIVAHEIRPPCLSPYPQYNRREILGGTAPQTPPLFSCLPPANSPPLRTSIRCKEVRIHGVSVRPTRKPKSSSRPPVTFLPRFAERRFPGTSSQEPPRKTRRPQSPLVHALPSSGAPL